VVVVVEDVVVDFLADEDDSLLAAVEPAIVVVVEDAALGLQQRGKHVGGHDKTVEASQNGHLQFLLSKPQETAAEETIEDVKYDYDLVVIGGGSGGLAASKVS